MAASPPSNPLRSAAIPQSAAVSGVCRLAALLSVLGGWLVPSSAASAAETSRCTEDVVVNGDNVDANYKTNAIQLRNVVISQCDIRVQAKSARANGLNIESTRWVFDGDVRIDVENRGNLRANQAEVEFKDGQIARLNITGEPAEFEQKRKESDDMARGHAREIIYDVTQGTVRLASDAWLTYGGNDLRCPQIFYDIRQQAAKCPSQPGSGQRVQFTIPANKPRAGEQKPAEDSKESPKTPAPGPGTATPAPGTAPKAP